MPWTCPACGTPIRQQLITAGDEAPCPGAIYRCTVCRVELVVDPDAHQMTPAPLAADMARDAHRKTQQDAGKST